MTLKLADVQRAIGEAMLDMIKTECRNIGSEEGVKQFEREIPKQLATGFDRVIAIEATALAIAAQKFKD